MKANTNATASENSTSTLSMPFSPGGGNTLSPSLSEQDDDEIDASPDRNMHGKLGAAKRNEVAGLLSHYASRA